MAISRHSPIALPFSLQFPSHRTRLVFLPLRTPSPWFFRTLKAGSTSTITPSRTVSSPVGGKDDIELLNERIRKEHRKRGDGNTGSTMDPDEAERYMGLVREQQQRGLQMLRGEEQKQLGGFGYRVDPYQLQPGDYVVHRKVGIGKFVKIQHVVTGEGSSGGQEYMFIEYADGMAKLPVEQAGRLLYRYNLSNETKKLKTLSKLSDPASWEKRRTKGKLAVQKMVVNLMELYLHRLKLKRPPHPKPLGMEEFCAHFPYEPTPDQKQAFIDVERDLTERGTPMDRLICGDVGFGKTEVALRAIFCVVSAGKQAMLLAPTIVLVRQHFEVIRERFSNYPHIRVGLLSRFQTKGEIQEYISMIKKGELDIIIGTHTLLGNRISYNNLGLLVVDEEQRFGVKQKEKIASLKTSVDVLTLSATPIPRTLYLALTGFRDASLISTPPPERVPVKTEVLAYSKDKVMAAIRYELNRGGQVYYVSPRITGLEEVKASVKSCYPDVSIAIAHGRLKPKEIEETMRSFAQGEIKILVCTHIVESGLDIKNANTIIIQDVQYFGMAQLYQLRGRVGRSDKEAFAYLFYHDITLLKDQAYEKLAAIEQYGELGQGFHLAERDMGIRGFGNIFGEQQTGDVGNVGTDLFFEMLFESLSKVEENRIVSVPYQNVQLDIDVAPHLPSDYINVLENPVELMNDAEKAAKKNIWSLIEFTENLRRQYGKEPYSMELILKKLYVRRMAADLGITKISKMNNTVYMATNMTKKTFKLMRDSVVSDVRRNCLSFDGSHIKGQISLDLPNEQVLTWIFQCLSELYAALPAFVKY
ncbi:Transcription-repair-coupling factor [Rhynchospora pubera]|uniref:Transcription-repair-coupling factor n=1 Tax=Rhynchospora pubera TaxID=906938 RepID=A0AAV8C8T0_9POAL|nr:Transcription-repair-coupling factor [Rhynchospora pubera]